MADFKLRDALLSAANRVQREGTMFPENDKRWEANAAAMTMFADDDTPIYQNIEGKRTNIRLFALVRVHRYTKRRGIDWPDFTFEAIIQWIIDNWEEILKVLFSLLIFII